MKTSRIQLRRFILENIGKILEAETDSEVTGRESGMSVSPHPLPGMTGLAVGDTVYLERDAYMSADIWAFGQDFPPIRVVELGNIEDLVGTTVPGDPAAPGEWEWLADATGPGFVGAYESSPGLDEEQLVFPVSAIDWDYTERGPKEPWEMPPGPGMFAGGPSEDDYVTLITSEDAVRPGEEVRLHQNMSGLDTGWAIIANPYWRFPEGHPQHMEEWRAKDGDTVIGVEEGTPGARPVADMYQIFRDDEEQERKEREAWFAEEQAEYEAEEAEDPYEWMEDRFHQEQEGWESDIEDERRDAQRAYDDAREAALAAAAAEEERMKTPEAGEHLPSSQGMGRRPRQGAARYERRGRRLSETNSLGADGLRDVILETLVEAIDQDEWRKWKRSLYTLETPKGGGGWLLRKNAVYDSLRNKADDLGVLLAIDEAGKLEDLEHLAEDLVERITASYEFKDLLSDIASGSIYDDDIIGIVEDGLGDNLREDGVSLEDWKQMIVDNLKNSPAGDEILTTEDLPDDYDYDYLWSQGTDAAGVAIDIHADWASDSYDMYSER